jgi:hypothetical protein
MAARQQRNERKLYGFVFAADYPGDGVLQLGDECGCRCGHALGIVPSLSELYNPTSLPLRSTVPEKRRVPDSLAAVMRHISHRKLDASLGNSAVRLNALAQVRDGASLSRYNPAYKRTGGLLLPYLKGLFVGAAALVLYAVLVAALPMLAALLGIWPGSAMGSNSGGGGFRGGAYTWTGSVNLTSPLFLAFAALIFIASFYWEFQRAAAIQK